MCVFVSVLIFVLLEFLFPFGLPMCTLVQLRICARKHANMSVRMGMALSSPASPLCDEGQPSVMWRLQPVTYPKSPQGCSSVMRGHYHWRVHCTGDKRGPACRQPALFTVTTQEQPHDACISKLNSHPLSSLSLPIASNVPGQSLFLSPSCLSLFLLSIFFCPNCSIFLFNAAGLAGPRWDCACQLWRWEWITSEQRSTVIMSPPALKKELTPSEDRNGMYGVPAELHPMSSFSISVSVGYRRTPYPQKSVCVVFVTFGPARVTLCVKYYCDIMYIIISTRLQLNTDVK